VFSNQSKFLDNRDENDYENILLELISRGFDNGQVFCKELGKQSYKLYMKIRQKR